MKEGLVRTVCGFAGLGLWLLISTGCTSTAMKGTPFYSGEYGPRRGPAEQRINGWPLLYYRDPALSVLWPVFESTEEHRAVRPLFSVYGLDRTNREYNVLWPLAQFDRQERENRIFPVFWGADYLVFFPLYWHFGHPWGAAGGTDALFPLWLLSRGPTNAFSLSVAWPLVNWWSHQDDGAEGSMVFPFYWHNRNDRGSLFVSLPWMSGTGPGGSAWRSAPPFYFQTSNATSSAVVTPFWAVGHSPTNDWQAVIPLAYWDRAQHTLLSPLWAHWQGDGHDTSLAPWLLSWWNQSPDRTDLWLAGALAHASWGEKPGSHYVVPFYYRNAADRKLVTPICGRGDNFLYPFTPLAGVRRGDRSGSWLFPLYSQSEARATGEVADTFLLLGGYHHAKEDRHSWFHPLFSYHDHGPLEALTAGGRPYQRVGTEFWCLPFCWYEDQGTLRPEQRHRGDTNEPGRSAVSPAPTRAAGEKPKPRLVKEYSLKHGAFPLWSYSRSETPDDGRSAINGSALCLLYDYQHEIGPGAGGKPGATNDYTRARVCWRLWHYERLNGNVSVDLFPGFTYDRKTDGYQKTSLLWRLFRDEREAGGARELDVLFMRILRTNPAAAAPARATPGRA